MSWERHGLLGDLWQAGVSTKHDGQPEESGIWFRLVDMGAEPSTV
jgi:hypothetical protein